MRFAIIDVTGKADDPRFDGMAVRYLKYELERLGATVVNLPQLADIVLLSSVSAAHWKSVPSLIKKNGIRRNRQKIILGGQCSTSPKSFEDYVDIICVGEGRRFIETLVNGGFNEAAKLPNSWIKGEDREVIPDYDFPYDIPPIKCLDGQTRIFASRGCKKKCLFCQIGWDREYTENSPERVAYLEKQLITNRHKINYVTNDLPSLSFFNQLNHYEHFSGSYSHLKIMLQEIGLKSLYSKMGDNPSIRIGVEASSERLRRFIGKPIKTKDLLETSCLLLNYGFKVKWFMILGLPGETDDDFMELRECVNYVKHNVTRGLLRINFTAFQPFPSTPLCIPPLEDSYQTRIDSFYDWFFEKSGYTCRVQLLRGCKPASRLEQAMGIMSCTEEELRRGWLFHDPPNWRVRYAYRDKIRIAYNAYAKKTGLPVGK
jgi:radical SAM superfamily enzyme YgiQ (UPF0313 family)